MKKQQAKSTKRVLASLLAASMAAGMIPFGAMSALALTGVDDTLEADRATASNQLTQYVNLETVGMQSGENIKNPDDQGSEHPRDLFDGQTTTKAGINKPSDTASTIVTWQTTQPVQVENYTLAGGNDSEGRDPKSWILSGSNDGNTYYVLDEVTDASLPIEYCAYYPEDYAVDSPRFYSYYKIEFTEYRGEEGYFQLSELVLSGQAEAPQPVTLPDALVHYDFADGANDASGNGNNGRPGSDVTIANGIATFAGGKNGNSVIVIDNPVAHQENLTVSAMVKVDSQPSNWAALWEAWTSKEDGKLIRFALRNNDEGAITLQTRTLVNGGGSLTNTTDAATMMPVGEWAELTFVSEGDTIRIYLNGKLLVEGSKTGDPAIKISASDLNEAAKIYIGRDPQWEDPGFAGQMSDFRVYNQALTADQIAAVYAENLEEFAFNPGERPADEAAGAVYDQIMALPDTITYNPVSYTHLGA